MEVSKDLVVGPDQGMALSGFWALDETLQSSELCSISGLVSNSNLSRWLFVIKDDYKKLFVSQHKIKFWDGRFWTVSLGLRAYRNTPDSILAYLKFQEQHTRQGWGPLKEAVSAQKALQGSGTQVRDVLGGIKAKSILPKERL